MSNRELLERLLDMVKFGWIARIWLDCTDIHKLPRYCREITQNCPKRQNIAQILHKIVEYCPSAQGTPHPGYNSLNHCHHPTPYSQQKRAAYSAFTFSTPIILFFVASRSCLVSCQSDSVIVAICSLKSHRSRF